MTQSLIDLDQIAVEKFSECIDELERTAEFLRWCIQQAKPDSLETWDWPERLDDAAASLREHWKP